MSTEYIKGTIAIPHVTGDIQITITATQVAPPNILTEDFTLAGQSYSPVGVTVGQRISTTGVNSAFENAFVTGFIPLADKDVTYTIDVPGWVLPAAGASNTGDAGAGYSTNAADFSGKVNFDHLTAESKNYPITANSDGTYTLTMDKAHHWTYGWRYFRLSFFTTTAQTTADASSIKITAQ